MRSARLVLAAVVALVLVAGCGGQQAGWTYAPAPSATPAGSPGASGSPAASGSAAPSGSAAASPSAGASESAAAGSPGAPAGGVTVVATDASKFDTPELTAPADKAFTLTFDNRDPSVPHNVVILKPDGSKVDMGDTSFFTGPAVRTYQVPALPAGAYPFHCEVHPSTMKGTLTVG